MKARALAAALDGRVIGAADAEITRAVHPAEASCDGDVAVAVSPDTIRILGARAERGWHSFQRVRSSHSSDFRL
jgi:L-aminopeptidase/D-esterase-like protein